MLLPPPSTAILQCPNIKANDAKKKMMRVRDVAPDVAMVDLMESHWMSNDDLEFLEDERTLERKKLGEGSFGAVFVARLKKNGKEVAVKELSLDPLASGIENDYLNLQNEIWTMR